MTHDFYLKQVGSQVVNNWAVERHYHGVCSDLFSIFQFQQQISVSWRVDVLSTKVCRYFYSWSHRVNLYVHMRLVKSDLMLLLRKIKKKWATTFHLNKQSNSRFMTIQIVWQFQGNFLIISSHCCLLSLGVIRLSCK